MARGKWPVDYSIEGNDMSKEQQDILEILKSELEFIETNGYGTLGERKVEATSTMFGDSPTCINYGYPYRTHPCGECPLIEFVPEDDRASAMPCHHIPLDSSGMTVEAMEQGKKPSDIQEVVKLWLQQTIKRIESEQPA